MLSETVSFIAFVILVAVCCCIFYSDATKRQIRNPLVVSVAVLSLLCSGLTAFASFPYLVAVLIGIGLFAANAIAGGDIKLILAFLPAIDRSWWVVVLLVIATLGGVMACGYLIYGLLTGKLSAVRQRGLPYGIPIGVGGLLGVWLTASSL
ncbi:prepilin peptidase [Endozoicomonadaceae bacterium StTr2]